MSLAPRRRRFTSARSRLSVRAASPLGVQLRERRIQRRDGVLVLGVDKFLYSKSAGRHPLSDQSRRTGQGAHSQAPSGRYAAPQSPGAEISRTALRRLEGPRRRPDDGLRRRPDRAPADPAASPRACASSDGTGHGPPSTARRRAAHGSSPRSARPGSPGCGSRCPSRRSRRRLSGLPEGVSVEPGRIEVRFSGAKDAVGRLFALAQALTNDYEQFEALVDWATPGAAGERR